MALTLFGVALASAPLQVFAAFPGANGKIAYSHNCRMYMVNADGSNNELVIKTPEGKCDTGPEWSPDGTKIAFLRSPLSGFHYQNVFIVDLADPQRPVRQVSYRSRVTESAVVWSPNGSELAFASTQAYGPGQPVTVALHTMDANGTNVRVLTSHRQDMTDFSSSWSPLGDEIVFTRHERRVDYQSLTRVMAVRVSDGSTRALTDEDRYSTSAEWSPTADKLVYVGSNGLGLMRPNGVAISSLTTVAGDSSPAWSPDGRYVAFVRGRSLQRLDTSTGELFTVVGGLEFVPGGTSWQPLARPITRIVGSLCGRAGKAGSSIPKVPAPAPVPVPGPINIQTPPCPSTSPVTTVLDDQPVLRAVTETRGFRPVNKALQCLDGEISLACVGDFVYRPTQVTEDAPDPAESLPQTGAPPPIAIPDLQLGEHVTYWTHYPGKGPGGTELVKSHESTVGRLTDLFADNDPLVDATAQLMPSTSGGGVGIQLTVNTVTRALGGTPPLLVKAVFSDRLAHAGSGFTRTTEVTFGYDARSDAHAPLTFSGTLTKEAAADTFTVTVQTSSPGSGLSLIAEMIQFGTETLRSTVARASFHPMPSLVRLGAAPGDVFRMEAYVSHNTNVDVHVQDGPSPDLTVDAGISTLAAGAQPGSILTTRSVGVAYNKNTKRLDLDSSAPTSNVTLDFVEQANDRLELHVNAFGVPTHLDLTMTELQPKGFRAAYNATGELSAVEVRVLDTSGLADRAQKLNLEALLIPPDIDVTLGVESGDFIDPHGGEIGSIRVQLIDGTSDESSPDNHIVNQGVLVRDVADRFVIAADVIGLRSLKLVRKAASSSACGTAAYSFCAEIDTTANRPLRIDIQQLTEEGRTEYVDGYLQYLPAGLTKVRFGTEPETRLFYESTAPAEYLELKMSMSDVENLWIVLTPLPRTIQFCVSGELGCTPGVTPIWPQKIVSLDVTASQHTLIELRNLALTNGDVIHGDVNVKKLRFWAVKEGTDDGELFADTDNEELVADVNLDVDGTTIYLHFPSGFRAQDQHVAWFDYGFILSDGEITCPQGTIANLTLLNGTIAIDLTRWLCA